MLLFLFLLPFVLGFWLVMTVLKLAIRLTFAVFALPIVLFAVALAALVAGVDLLFALLIPLLPVLAVGFLVWLLTRSSRAATAIPN